MKTKILPLLLALNFLAILAFAQAGKRSHRQANSALQAELKIYVQKNITPVMHQQRLKLEKQLSSNDQKKIRDLRIQLAAAHQSQQVLRDNLRAQRQSGTQLLSEDQKVQLQNHRIQTQQIRSKTQVLAQKYDSQIKALYQEVATPAQTWRQELTAIIQKYRPTNNSNPAVGPGQGSKNHPLLHHLMGEYFRPAAFLLWEVNKPLSDVFGGPASEPRLFPNPVTAQAVLEYTVKEKGQVTIDLLDESGRVIWNLLTTNREPGKYNLDLNVSNLKTGLYFYKITTQSGTVTERFFKK